MVHIIDFQIKYRCRNTICPSNQTLSGIQNVGAGSSSTPLNGCYNLSNYKVSCGGYSSCSSCCLGINWDVTLPSGSTKSISVTNINYY